MAEDERQWRRHLAALIKEHREALRLSVSKAAAKAGIDRGTWTAAEDGTRNTRDVHLAAIEAGLGLPVGTLREEAARRTRHSTPVDERTREAARGAGLSDREVTWILAATPRQLVARYLDRAEDPAYGPDRAQGWLVRAIGTRENYLRGVPREDEGGNEQAAERVG